MPERRPMSEEQVADQCRTRTVCSRAALPFDVGGKIYTSIKTQKPQKKSFFLRFFTFYRDKTYSRELSPYFLFCMNKKWGQKKGFENHGLDHTGLSMILTAHLLFVIHRSSGTYIRGKVPLKICFSIHYVYNIVKFGRRLGSIGQSQFCGHVPVSRPVVHFIPVNRS